MINVALIYLALMFLAQAAPISLGELLRNPDRFSEQSVKVTGRVDNVREGGWRRPYYTFDLSDGTETIRVIAFGNAPCRSGTVIVEGTFGQIKWLANLRASYDEIMAQSVVCLPDHMPSRGSTGK
jgi:hypothetical protein